MGFAEPVPEAFPGRDDPARRFNAVLSRSPRNTRQLVHEKLRQDWPYFLLLAPLITLWLDKSLALGAHRAIADVALVLMTLVAVAVIQSQKRRLHAASLTDPLTGLFNAKHLQSELERLTGLAHRTGTPLTVLFMDIDDFKSVNDRLGHAQGNELLKAFAQELIGVTKRDVDLCFRFGGDEFVVLCQLTDLSGGWEVARRIHQAIGVPSPLATLGIGVSIGVVELAEESAADVLKRADHAMYVAKRSAKSALETSGAGTRR